MPKRKDREIVHLQIIDKRSSEYYVWKESEALRSLCQGV
jgi:hypothetical protein